MAIISLYIQTAINATLQISLVLPIQFLIPVSPRIAQPVTQRILDGPHRRIAMQMRYRVSPRTTDIDRQRAQSVTRIQRTIQSLAAKAVDVIIRALEVVIDIDEHINEPNYTKG